MGRPAPKDLDYAPTQAKSFLAADFATTDIDLTNQFPAGSAAPTSATSGEFAYPACTLHIASVTAAAAATEALVVCMQASGSTFVDVIIQVCKGQTLQLRGAFSRIRATNNSPTGTSAALCITAFWQGGPS